MNWRMRTFLICAYGTVKEFRPATPFLTPFLESSSKNFTNAELYSQVYPFSTYSYMLSMVPIFILTDSLRYKPVVVLEALTLSATWAFLIWGKSVFHMQLMQIIFGVASSSEIAYFSFMYAVVGRRHFPKVTSYIRTATLVGKFFAFSMAQILITTGIGTYLLLNQITFGAVLLALVTTVFIPLPPKHRLVDDRISSADSISKLDTTCPQDETEIQSEKSLNMRTRLKSVYSAFQNRVVLMWSLWWALASCGTYQVANYAQTLWGPIQNEGQFIGNGFVECSNTLLSAFLTFSLQFYKSRLSKSGDKLIFLSSFVSAFLLYGMAVTNNIFVSYAFYVINSSIYSLLIAAASAIIASELNTSNYSLVFGFNTFVALVFQTILTLVVSDSHGFALPIRTQFVVYSGFFGVIGLIFSSVLVLNCCFPKTVHDDELAGRTRNNIQRNDEVN